MTTPQTTARVAPRLRNRPATLVTALGVLVAIAVSVVILALTGAHHTTTTTTTIPVTAAQAAAESVPQTHYLGPRQTRAGLSPQTTHAQASGSIVPHYTCLGAAQHCLP